MAVEIDQERLASIKELTPGGHSSPEQGLCLLEAVAFVRRMPHTDKPACVSPSVGAVGRAFNDGPFRQHLSLLMPYIVRIAGTASTDEVERQRGYILTDWCCRETAPIAFDAAELTDHAATLRALAPVVDDATQLTARSAAAGAAWAAEAAEAAEAAWAAEAAEAAWAAGAALAALAAGAAREAWAASAEKDQKAEEIRASCLRLLDRLIAVGQEVTA